MSKIQKNKKGVKTTFFYLIFLKFGLKNQDFSKK